MKTFIHYETKNDNAVFEGARMRKTLKGACEEAGIDWVDSRQEGAEISHFISPRDYRIAASEKERGSKVVVSAFYTENDPNASFFKELWNGKEKLSAKAKKILTIADLILVPSIAMKQFIEPMGFNGRIEVLRPTVNLARFSRTSNEANIFPRYFGLKEATPTVITSGSYADVKTLTFIKNLAKACPKIQFYFFGSLPKSDPIGVAKIAANISKPRNLTFLKAVQDDIFRSGILYSMAYIATASIRPDAIHPLEAFAAETQVVTIGTPLSDGENRLLSEGKTCFYFDTPEKMAKYLIALQSNAATTTVVPAYSVAKSHSLPHFGKKLKEFYESIFEKEVQP